MEDIDAVLALTPGKKRLNLHASYAVFEGDQVDRDQIKPEHFRPWIEFAKDRGLGLDFNPTLFSHPKAAGLTLSHPDPEIRKFWIRHCQACLRISEVFAEELNTYCPVSYTHLDVYKRQTANWALRSKILKVC